MNPTKRDLELLEASALLGMMSKLVAQHELGQISDEEYSDKLAALGKHFDAYRAKYGGT